MRLLLTGNNVRLNRISLGNKQLTGSLPDSIGNFSRLQSL